MNPSAPGSVPLTEEESGICRLFLEAADVLNRPDATPQHRREADRWLDRVIRQPTMWSVAQSILENNVAGAQQTLPNPNQQQLPLHTIHLASVALRTKCETLLDEIPPGPLRQQLQNSLLNGLIRHSAHSAPATQLALAFSELIMQEPSIRATLPALLSSLTADTLFHLLAGIAEKARSYRHHRSSHPTAQNPIHDLLPLRIPVLNWIANVLQTAGESLPSAPASVPEPLVAALVTYAQVPDPWSLPLPVWDLDAQMLRPDEPYSPGPLAFWKPMGSAGLSDERLRGILRIVRMWLGIGGSLQNSSAQNQSADAELNHPVVWWALHAIRRPPLADAAASVLMTVLRTGPLSRPLANPAESPLAVYLVQLLLAIRPVLLEAASVSDQETVVWITDLYCSAVESFSSCCVLPQQPTSVMATCLLFHLVRVPHPDSFRLSVDVWHRLAGLITRSIEKIASRSAGGQRNPDDDDSESEDDSEDSAADSLNKGNGLSLAPESFFNGNIAGYFESLYTGLVAVALERIQLPAVDAVYNSYTKESSQRDGDESDLKELYDQRETAYDLLVDCSRVLGMPKLLGLIVQSAAAHFQTLAQGKGWAGFEACLSATAALARPFLRLYWEARRNSESALQAASGQMDGVTPLNTPIVQIVQCLPHLPSNIPIITEAAARLSHYLAPWFRSNPSYLSPIFPLLSQALLSPVHGATAARAFGSIFHHCSEHTISVIPQIIAYLPQLPHLSITAREDLLIGTGMALSSEIGQPHFQSISQAFFTDIFKLLETELNGLTAPPPGSGRSNTRDFYLRLLRAFDQLSAFLKSIRIENEAILVELNSRLWPVIRAFLTHPVARTQELIMERVIRCSKYLLQSIQELFKPNVAEFLTIVYQNYSAHHFSCFIYACSQVFGIFRDDQELYTLFSTAIGYYIENTVTFLLTSCGNQGSTDLYSAFPDLVEDFFNLVSRTIREINESFIIRSPNLGDLITVAANGLHIQHVESCLSIVTCLHNIFSTGVSHEPFPEQQMSLGIIQQALALNDRGLVLTRNVMMAIGGFAPSSIIPEFLSMLEVFAVVATPVFGSWLASTFSGYPQHVQQQLVTHAIHEGFVSGDIQYFRRGVSGFRRIAQKYKLF